MGAIDGGSLRADLKRAQSQFLAWRGRRTRGTRIPRTLWAVAVGLAKTHGVCRAATALGLDYYSLKKRTESRASPRQSDGPAFVEFTAPAFQPRGLATTGSLFSRSPEGHDPLADEDLLLGQSRFDHPRVEDFVKRAYSRLAEGIDPFVDPPSCPLEHCQPPCRDGAWIG